MFQVITTEEEFVWLKNGGDVFYIPYLIILYQLK